MAGYGAGDGAGVGAGYMAGYGAGQGAGIGEDGSWEGWGWEYREWVFQIIADLLTLTPAYFQKAQAIWLGMELVMGQVLELVTWPATALVLERDTDLADTDLAARFTRRMTIISLIVLFL